jgi:hypothetical protein
MVVGSIGRGAFAAIGRRGGKVWMRGGGGRGGGGGGGVGMAMVGTIHFGVGEEFVAAEFAILQCRECMLLLILQPKIGECERQLHLAFTKN